MATEGIILPIGCKVGPYLHQPHSWREGFLNHRVIECPGVSEDPITSEIVKDNLNKMVFEARRRAMVKPCRNPFAEAGGEKHRFYIVEIISWADTIEFQCQKCGGYLWVHRSVYHMTGQMYVDTLSDRKDLNVKWL